MPRPRKGEDRRSVAVLPLARVGQRGGQVQQIGGVHSHVSILPQGADRAR